MDIGSSCSYDVENATKRRKLEVRRGLPADAGTDFANRTLGSNQVGKSRQCVFYIESKGRQCVRWANDGDLYCCVHLNSRLTVKPASPVNSVPCAGTTVHGTRCKHRSLPGGTYCKKHRVEEKSANEEEDEGTKCIADCDDTPKHYSLYCEKHVPGWLKRSRNGKTRIISKDVFAELLRSLPKEESKSLHEACDLFYEFFKTTQFLRKPLPLETQLDWIAAEAAKRRRAGEILLQLVSLEKAQLDCWRFEDEPSGLCRGYACAICFESFPSKDLLQVHVQGRHHVGFVEQCLLFQCAICSDNFGNEDELRSHALSAHREESREREEMEESFDCKLCEMKFDYLPDLGRHHQTEHLGKCLIDRQQRRGISYFSYRLKAKRRSYRLKNRGRKRGVPEHPQPQETKENQMDARFPAVAMEIYDNIVKTKPRPGNYEIIAIARASCCNVSLKAKLEERYGALPDRFFLKAAKLCSESSIQVEWHREGFVCARGCIPFKEPELLAPALPRTEGFSVSNLNNENSRQHYNDQWESDECHFIIGLSDLKGNQNEKRAYLTRDISFGKELIPIACIVDEDAFDSSLSPPWKSFEYIIRPLVSPSCNPCEIMHLGCSCRSFSCCSSSCDHSYLFLNDFEDSRDVHGKPMQGRLAYDDKGRIILEEGYVVYECNETCSCSKGCLNRVLQKGVRLKLEICKTVGKDWTVRAGEPILRGMFVCEYMGEVLDYAEASKRRFVNPQMCVVPCNVANGRNGFMLEVNHQLNDVGRIIQEESTYFIDATHYGNVARFINHSSSSNLVNYQVIVESMDPRFAHIGLYASRDIATGEELTFNYRSSRSDNGA